MPAGKKKQPTPRNRTRSKRVDGGTSQQADKAENVTLEVLEEKSYRKMLWSLSYMCRMQIAHNTGGVICDPVKKDRLEFTSMLKDNKQGQKWGYDRTMALMQVRLEACKMLKDVLGKKKIGRSTKLPAGADPMSQGMVDLFDALGATKSMRTARKLILDAIEAKAVTKEVGQQILNDVQDEYEEQGLPTDDFAKAQEIAGDPLKALMEESVTGAEEEKAEQDGEDEDS